MEFLSPSSDKADFFPLSVAHLVVAFGIGVILETLKNLKKILQDNY